MVSTGPGPGQSPKTAFESVPSTDQTPRICGPACYRDAPVAKSIPELAIAL